MRITILVVAFNFLLLSFAAPAKAVCDPADQIAPNPNPEGDTLTLTSDTACNAEDPYSNLGTLNNDGTFTNLGTLNNSVLGSTVRGELNNNGTLINEGVISNTVGGTEGGLGTLNNYGFLGNNGSIYSRGGGFLNNYGTLDNNGEIRQYFGAIYNHGTLNNKGKFYAAMAFPENTGTLNNYGQITTETIRNSGVLNNFVGGTATFLLALWNTGTINNDGTLNNTYASRWENAGIINNNSGALFTSQNLDNGATATLNNHGTLNSTRRLNNYGLVYNLNGTLNNSGTLSNYGTFLSFGVFDNSGTLNNHGEIRTAFSLRNRGSVSNLGEISFDFAQNHGVIDNNSGGTLDLGLFVNYGTLNNNAGAVTNVLVDLRNESSSTLNNNGDLNFNGKISYSDGIFNNNFGGTVNNNRSFLNKASSSLNNSGVWNNNYGGAGLIAGLENAGLLNNNNGGVFNNNGTLINNSAGTLNNHGSLNNNSDLTNHGTLLNTGVLNNTSSNSGPVSTNNYGLLINDGTIKSWTSGGVNGQIFNYGTLVNNGLIDSTYGSITNSGTLDNFGKIRQSFPRLTNTGTLNNHGDISSELLSNDGLLINHLGATAFFAAGTGTNTGVINTRGILEFGRAITNSGQVLVPSEGSIVTGYFVQTAGKTVVDGAITTSASARRGVEINGGILSGNGSITGQVTMDGGTLAVGNSPGSMSIYGDYIQTDAGSFAAEIGGLLQGFEYDFLSVSGTATLDGLLDVSLFNWGDGIFSPEWGDSFDILSAENIVGRFSTLSLADLGRDLKWQVSYLTDAYDSTDVVRLEVIAAVPEPEVYALMGVGLGLIGWVARKKRKQLVTHSS